MNEIIQHIIRYFHFSIFILNIVLIIEILIYFTQSTHDIVDTYYKVTHQYDSSNIRSHRFM